MLGGHPTFISGLFQLFKNKSCIFKEKDQPYVMWKKNIVELEFFFPRHNKPMIIVSSSIYNLHFE